MSSKLDFYHLIYKNCKFDTHDRFNIKYLNLKFLFEFELYNEHNVIFDFRFFL